MRSLDSSRLFTVLPALLPSLVLACSAGEPGATGEPDLGGGAPVLTSSTNTSNSDESPAETDEECLEGDRQLNAHALAASLAVAVADELHRWDAVGDFQLRAGKLALSATGELHCPSGCSNIRALLSLQDAASSVVPGHDPAAFRDQLASWYSRQESTLQQLMEQKLVVDKGVFRLKSHLSGKYMQVNAGSLAENAPVQQRTTASQPGANEWRVLLDHSWHRLVNVRSGKCLSLSQDSSAQNVTLVQQACSSSALQRFGFTKHYEYYGLISKTGQTLRSRESSTAEDAPLVQGAADISQSSQQWSLEAVSTATLSPNAVADGMYTVVAMQSGKSITIDAGNPGENAAVEQDTFAAGDDRYQWYLARIEGDAYVFINRRTGKCLDLESTDAAGRLLQRSCSDAATQRFTLNAAGDGTHVLYGLPGKAVEIEGNSTNDRARLVLGNDGSWSEHRRFVLTPVLAGEPHRLSPSHVAAAGCSDVHWYDIEQPSGEALRTPAEAFVQLMFAGGRQAASSSDENPFVEQQPSQAALEISGYLNGSSAAPGSCVASDLLYDASGAAAGACCSKHGGSAGKLQLASWSPTLYLCR